jgi:site-specific DNA-methyltransferase (adenine-specific)
MINTVVLGDCLEVMKSIETGSVDMILCDLPYGTTACSWDIVISFNKLWDQYRRIIKPNGAIVLTASQPFTSILISSNLEMFKYCWVWEKENGTNFFNAKHQPMKVHEDICVFSLSAASFSRKGSMVYNPQMTEGKPYKANNDQESGKMVFNEHPKGSKKDNNGVRFPRSIQKFNSKKGLHPTQKPVALFKYLIKTYTQKGDLVLDNCIGSGTTAIACLATGRNFIGIEKDPTYHKMSLARIEKFKEKLTQPLAVDTI